MRYIQLGEFDTNHLAAKTAGAGWRDRGSDGL
jgi:hypothetical protein